VAQGPLADVTGGEGFRNTNDIGRVIDIVRRDTGTYYLLGIGRHRRRRRRSFAPSR
jgi:hypothetical protein